MNIQRKYSLPNCTLLLEGLSDAAKAMHFQEMRPQLSILVNAECYISASKQPVAGGREFFESLVRAVSAYAQEFLSGVPHPEAHGEESELVRFEKIDNNRHRMIISNENTTQDKDASTNGKSPIQIDLNTLQLFDLVEAVDQFFADSQTLPELSLQLQSVSRRFSGTSEILLKQAVPATVGVSSLAAAALAFGLIPAPVVRPPEPKAQEDTNSTTQNVNSPATNGTSSPSANEQIAASPTFTPTDKTTATPTATASPNSSSAVKDLEAVLKTVPEITNASQLRALNRQLYNQINPDWNNRSQVNQELAYRVGVAPDGSIIGYKALNKASNDSVAVTPLPNLLNNPAKRQPAGNEPIAQFRVVFTSTGVLQVSPWRGYSSKPDVVGERITAPTTVQTLREKLYNQISQNWSTNSSSNFPRDLKYRVAVNKEGVIADYEPLNQVAFDYFRETPLPTMFQEVYGSNLAAPDHKQPLAHFEVTFKTNRTMEVVSWQGY
jgi:hypothetical protein